MITNNLGRTKDIIKNQARIVAMKGQTHIRLCYSTELPYSCQKNTITSYFVLSLPLR